MKKYIVEIEVPSGSRVVKYWTWLSRILEPHRMKLRKVTDSETGESLENDSDDATE